MIDDGKTVSRSGKVTLLALVVLYIFCDYAPHVTFGKAQSGKI